MAEKKLSLKELISAKAKDIYDAIPVAGEGHFAAMSRLGLKELRNAVNPSRESVADTEIGLYGTLTQGEIAQARGGAGGGPEQETKMSMEQLKDYAKDRAAEAQQRMEKGQDKGMEM